MFRKREWLFNIRVWIIVLVASILSFQLAVTGKGLAANKEEYKLVKSWGKMGNGNGEFNQPCGIAADKKGYIYVADSGNKRVQKFSADGKFINMWHTTNRPTAIAVDVSGNIYVAESGSDMGLIEKFTPEGKRIESWKYEGRVLKFKDKVYRDSSAGGMAVSGGYVYLGNNSTRSVQKFSADGKLVKFWGNLRVCCGFLDVAADKEGNIYVAELGAFKVRVFDSNGNFIRSWGKEGEGKGEFSPCCNPVHIAVVGNRVFTSEKTTPRIQVFTTSGEYICTFGKGQFSKACGYLDLAIAPSGRVYAVDDAACRVNVFEK